MAKRAFIVYGWDGYPEEGWFPWLKAKLEQQGFMVFVPELPESDRPKIHSWVPKLAKAVGTPDSQTYFVGHSIGCQTIARYLESLPKEIKVGGAVFVAGFFKRLSGLEDDDEVREIAQHWLYTSIDLDKVKSRLGKSVAIFSDNDPYIPLDNQEDFKEKLNSKIVIEHEMGHFSGTQGLTELPTVLNEFLKMTSDAPTLK